VVAEELAEAAVVAIAGFVPGVPAVCQH